METLDHEPVQDASSGAQRVKSGSLYPHVDGAGKSEQRPDLPQVLLRPDGDHELLDRLGRIEPIGVTEDDVFDSVGKSLRLGDRCFILTLPADENLHQDLIGKFRLGVNLHLDTATGSGPVHTGQELGDASAETTEQS